MREISVDFPALGNPTRPTSASSFNSRRSCFCSPSSPGSMRRGARLVDETNRALPRPPRPPAPRARAGPPPRGRRPDAARRRPSRTPACRSGTAISRSSAGLAGAVRSLTVLAAPCFEIGVKAEVDERVLGGDGGDVDRATTAAVAAVGSAARDVLLSPETEAAVAAGTGGHVDVDFVDEHRRIQDSGIRIQNRPDS